MSKSPSPTPPTAPTSTDRRDQRRKLTGIVLGLTTVIALMVVASPHLP